MVIISTDMAVPRENDACYRLRQCVFWSIPAISSQRGREARDWNCMATSILYIGPPVKRQSPL